MDNNTISVSNTVTRVRVINKEFILVGTAHISRASVDEVEQTIRSQKPDTVCVELDASRYKTIVDEGSWKKLDISKVLKEGKGFLLFANLILSSFQRRMGMDMGTKPGEEMIRALDVAKELNIPIEFCDREVQTTLRRAWAKSSFWGKNKMLAALLSSVFSNEKLSVEEMEKLKEKSLMNSMMDELSGFLPKVKEVLIDERDRYIASKLYGTKGEKIVAVLGAGHIEGVVSTLKKLEAREMENSVEDLEQIPKKNIIGRLIPWIIPVAVPALLVLGFFTKGVDTSMNGILSWIIATSASAGIGALIAFGHPAAIFSAMVSAPITALLPVIGSGMVSGLVQYRLRKPRVTDFEGLQEDFNKFTGFYKNRILKVLWVFMLTNLCGSFGTIAGISLIGSLLGGS